MPLNCVSYVQDLSILSVPLSLFLSRMTSISSFLQQGFPPNSKLQVTGLHSGSPGAEVNP